MSDLKLQISEDMKTAMRAKDKLRLLTVRTILAAIKQQEIDTREAVDDAAIIVILDKMSKQRRESIAQFSKAGRDDLVVQEEQELLIIQEYLPEQLSDEEIISLIKEAIASTNASCMKDMGKVMGYIKPKAQGRADMGKMSALIKDSLN